MTRQVIHRQLKIASQTLWPEVTAKLLLDSPEAIARSVTVPKEMKFGDFTTNLAMTMAGRVNNNPLTTAELLVEQIRSKLSMVFSSIEILPPGYINFTYSKKWLERQVATILKEGPAYGRSDIGHDQKVMVEFISANPTGPLTLGNGRGGFFGDVLGNVLRASGYRARKEYYLNDVGNQVDILAESVTRRYLQLKGINVNYPEECYQGAYIQELARNISLDDVTLGNVAKIKESIKGKVLETMIAGIMRVIKDHLKVHFDYWFRESFLYEKGKVDKVMKLLEERKMVYLQDGAVWLRTTTFGDDKDRVLRKSDGQQTYFLSDIAYHYNKFVERGFQRVVDVWGADHHGYINRLQASMKALGIEQPLDIVIMQLVRLIQDGQEVKMSKRSGTFVTIEELIDEVGLDVARFFFLMRAPNTHMDFDLNLAKDTSDKNPVYYVQYAHARIASILTNIKKVEPKWKPTLTMAVSHQSEVELARRLAQFPDLVSEMAESYDVHRLPYYAIQLADDFHSFYTELRVIDQDSVNQPRANLSVATKIVLANVLKLMGVSAPEKMAKKAED